MQTHTLTSGSLQIFAHLRGESVFLGLIGLTLAFLTMPFLASAAEHGPKEVFSVKDCSSYLKSANTLGFELSVACKVKQKYGSIIGPVAELHDYDENLITAVIVVESQGKTTATSPVGAKGLMQLMPGTAKYMGASDIRDPLENILAGTRYLRRLENVYGFDTVEGALLAYNMGPRKAQEWLSESGRSATDASYVKKVMDIYNQLREADAEEKARVEKESTDEFLTKFLERITQSTAQKYPPVLLSARRLEIEAKEE